MRDRSLVCIAALITAALITLSTGFGNPSNGRHTQLSTINTRDSRDLTNSAARHSNVPFVVYQKSDGKLVTNLKKENVAVFLDDVQRNITDFSAPDRPLAIAFVVEYSKLGTSLGDNKNLGFGTLSLSLVEPVGNLLNQLITAPNDFASVVAFDIRPTPMTDLTNDQKRIRDALNLLTRNTPAFRETALFDSLKLILLGGRGDSAVLDKSDNAQADHSGLITIQGSRRAILLVASGIDTSSKTKYSQLRKIAQDAEIPILVISTVGIYTATVGSRLSRKDQERLKQAESDLNAIAVETGGALYSYAAESDLPVLLKKIDAMIRGQYNLTFDPGDLHDGRAHKIVVKADINSDGIYDEQAVLIQARQIYNASKN